MRYLKILSAGITVALITEILGVAVGAVKCILSGIKINGSVLLSVASGVGAREGIYLGLVVMLLMFVGTWRSRSP